MGTRPGSAIASIGACVFDPLTGVIGQDFYRSISLASCQRARMTFDADTVVWWLKQGDAARKAAVEGAADIAEGLGHFFGWYRHVGGARLWSHGGNFDEPLLSAAARATGLDLPWKYWDGRCTRTIFELAGVKPDRAAGTHHKALDDARAQAVAVCAAYAKLGLAGVPA